MEHLVEAIVVPLLKLTKVMLHELLGSGNFEVNARIRYVMCDTIKGNESHVKDFHFWDFNSNLQMLHFDASILDMQLQSYKEFINSQSNESKLTIG